MLNHAKKEVLASLEGLVLQAIERHAQSWKEWHPGDLLFPKDIISSERDRIDHIRELSAESSSISPAVRACFALNALTEAGLPHFTRLIARYLGDADFWKLWNGRWTAEENRHDEVLKGYAYLTNLIDLRTLDRLEFEYLEEGFRPAWKDEKGEDDPYQLLAYTSIQEEATYRSHRNVSKLVKWGAPHLCRILARVAGEEMAHADFYQKVSEGALKADPDEMLVSFLAALREFSMPGISIPAFANLSYIAKRLGVFTALDLKEIVGRLIARFGIEHLSGLKPRGREAQERIMRMPVFLERVHDRFLREPVRGFLVPFFEAPLRL